MRVLRLGTLIGMLVLSSRPVAVSGSAGSSPGSAAQSADSVLTLVEAARLAVAQYPSVSAARAGGAVSAAALGQVRSLWWPALEGRGTLTHFEEPMVVAPFHGLDFESPPAFDETLVQGHVELGYTVWDGGRRGARLDRARWLVSASGAAVEGAEQAVLARLVTAYLEAQTQGAVLAAHERRIEALEAERARVAAQLEQGRVARVQLMRAEAALSRARADRVAAASALSLSLGELARLTGLAPGAVDAGSLVEVRLSDAAGPVPSGLVEAALSSNPELDRRRRELAAAEAGIREARSDYYPRVSVAGRYSSFGSAAGEFTGEWNAGVRLSYPIFTGFARARSVERARAEATVRAEELRLAELRTASAVDSAVAAVGSAVARREALESAVTQLSEVVRVELLALESGVGVQTDYLSAEAELLSATAELARSRSELVASRVALARALGELTVAWVERNLEGS